MNEVQLPTKPATRAATRNYVIMCAVATVIMAVLVAATAVLIND